jgi:hypothetical protein
MVVSRLVVCRGEAWLEMEQYPYHHNRASDQPELPLDCSFSRVDDVEVERMCGDSVLDSS